MREHHHQSPHTIGKDRGSKSRNRGGGRQEPDGRAFASTAQKRHHRQAANIRLVVDSVEKVAFGSRTKFLKATGACASFARGGAVSASHANKRAPLHLNLRGAFSDVAAGTRVGCLIDR